MMMCLGRVGFTRAVAALLVLFCWATTIQAAVLVADRLSNRVLKYSDGGTFIGVVASDANLSQPNGMIVSPDGTKLYVANRGNSSVVRYDFNGTTGTNPQVYTTASSGTMVPIWAAASPSAVPAWRTTPQAICSWAVTARAPPAERC